MREVGVFSYCKMAQRSEPFSGPTYKVILLGDPGVGKTTLFLRLQRGSFVDTEAQSTIGVDYTEKDFTFGDTTVKVRYSNTIVIIIRAC